MAAQKLCSGPHLERLVDNQGIDTENRQYVIFHKPGSCDISPSSKTPISLPLMQVH